MERHGDKIHINEVEVSGGSKEGVGRWVLGVSLVLTVIVLSLMWIIPALSSQS